MTAPVGRPTLYKPEYCEAIVKHMTNGDSLVSFAKSIDVSRDSLHAWGREFPAFSDAMKKGKDYAEVWWEERGKKNLEVDKDAPKFNDRIYSLTMKARFGWRDKEPVEIVTPQGEALQVYHLPEKKKISEDE